MARAKTQTLIPLDRAAEVIGIDPLHFNSIYTAQRPLEYACDDVWYQYDWQNGGKYSRERLAYYLHQTERKVAYYLGYYPLPVWIESEDHPLPEFYRPQVRSIRNINGQPKSVTTQYGYVIECGIKAKTLIESGASIVYSDEDGDGWDETATVTVSTTVTDKEEIHVYFPDKSGQDSWEIRPVEIDLDTDAQTATLTFKRAYAVQPLLWEALPAPDGPTIAVDGDDASNFITTVDVYRVYNDSSQQVVFNYEHDNSTSTGVGIVRNPRLGIVAYSPATWDAETQTWTTITCNYWPNRLQLWYHAGQRNYEYDYPSREMDAELERLIVYYAVSISGELCGCYVSQAFIDELTEDLALINNARSYQVLGGMLNNPLGTTRAAVNLWQYILHHRIGQ